MARTIDSAKRVINGTYGEVWVDGEKIAECTACQAKVTKNKTTINLCGQFMSDQQGDQRQRDGQPDAAQGGQRLYHSSSRACRTAWTCGSPLFPSCGTRTATAQSAWRFTTSALTT